MVLALSGDSKCKLGDLGVVFMILYNREKEKNCLRYKFRD
jgi:hypothetical protein